MVDTCVLAELAVSDVETIEVYPSGVSSRPGIERNPFGLILIFRQRD